MYRLLLTIWLISDLVLFVASYAIAYFLRVGFIFSSDFPFDAFLGTAALTAPIWLIVLMTTRTFALTRNQKTLRNVAYISYSSLVGVAVFTLLYYFSFTAFFSRLLLVTAFLLSTGILWLWHMLFEYILRRTLYTTTTFPTLIVGVTNESRDLIHTLQKHYSPLRPVAILDGRGCKDADIHGIPVLGKLNKLEEVLSTGITHLIQCSDLEQSLNLLSASRNHRVTYMLLPSVLGMVEGDEKIEQLEGKPVTMVDAQNRWWIFR